MKKKGFDYESRGHLTHPQKMSIAWSFEDDEKTHTLKARNAKRNIATSSNPRLSTQRNTRTSHHSTTKKIERSLESFWKVETKAIEQKTAGRYGATNPS